MLGLSLQVWRNPFAHGTTIVCTHLKIACCTHKSVPCGIKVCCFGGTGALLCGFCAQNTHHFYMITRP